MKNRMICFLVLVLLFPAVSFAEESFLNSVVLLVGENDETTPAIGIDVTIEESGDTGKTKSAGLFRISLAEKLKVKGSVKLSVNKPGWVIQYPLDGEAPIPTNLDALVRVRLLPKGSMKLWSAERLQKFIKDTAEKAKSEVKPEATRQQIDFGRYIKDWAVEYGFTPQQAKAEIDKWIDEVERKQDDFYELGLAEYAKKNFKKAYELSKESAERNAKQFKEESQKAEEHREDAIRDYRFAGNAAYQDYRFSESVDAYTHALQFVSKEESPWLWGAVLNEIGKSNWAVGIRAGGEVSQQHLSAAVAALRDALQVLTREVFPKQWAMTLSNLGAALDDQGIRTGGEKGRQLLAQAVAAYRNALTVYTPGQLPQQWAMTQNNLGAVLQEQGIRTGGDKGRQLLAQAISAYRAALKVKTREHLPEEWAQTHKNLAEASLYLEDWPQAAESYRNVLVLYPDDAEAYLAANGIYQEKLFAYAEAFEVTKHWLERHPDDLAAQMNFAEAHFTTGRFAEAETRLQTLLAKPLDATAVIPLQALHIATLMALNEREAIPSKLEALREAITKQPDTFKLGWSFAGSKHFINQDERLADHRIWLLQLLSSLEEKDRDSILTALQVARENFRAL